MEDFVDTFVEIWYILYPFGMVYGHLVIFSRLGKLHQRKSGNPGPTGKVVNVFTPRVQRRGKTFIPRVQRRGKTFIPRAQRSHPLLLKTDLRCQRSLCTQ
jgi:hypothetical protein